VVQSCLHPTLSKNAKDGAPERFGVGLKRTGNGNGNCNDNCNGKGNSNCSGKGGSPNLYFGEMFAMRHSGVGLGLLALVLLGGGGRGDSQTQGAADQGAGTYGLRVFDDEVILTFHAADANGLPVNDLKIDELKLLDNGRAPRKVLAFQSLRDFPIRAGILIDTSESMRETLAGNRAISIQYAQKLLRQKTDEAFVMDFGRVSQVLQPWTNDASLLTAGVGRITAGGEGRLSGTAIFDAIFRACSTQFGKVDQAASGNFILLFSDGEDNASRVSLKDAVAMCQRSNTAIYAFRTDAKDSFGSPGPQTLAELAAETGGRVFHDVGSEAGAYEDLRSIEADLRNQYRLVYKAADLKHDRSFHRIEIRGPERVDKITVRSGYYAPALPAE
jgi:Ca-activated chloride channel family protein